MASATYNGRTFYTGDTIYFTEYWQNSYNTAAAGVYSNKYSFYATINDLIATGNNRTHNVKFTSLHNTSGTITGGGGYCTPTSITKGYKVTVSYHHNGGSGTGSQFGYVGASLTGTSSRTGYQFAGWYNSTASNASRVTVIPQNGTTYYAHWTGNTWYVAFNGNGNTGGSTATETFTYGTAKALTANGFTRTGYQFNGWNTNAAGTGTNYSNGQSVSNLTTTNKGTVNLYAKWLANTYTVIFNGNGALSGSMPDQSFTYDQAQNLSELGFSKGVAYKFTGWNTMPDGTGDSYDDEESVSNLTATNGGNVVLYAQWELTYIAPTVNDITSIRYENGVEDDAGTQIHIEFDWAADLIVSDTNYISDILVEYKLQSASTWTQLFHQTYSSQSSSSISGHFSQTSATSTANTDSTYDIRISLTDVYGPSIEIPSPQTISTDFLSTAYFTMDFATGGYGIGIGCPAPNTGLKIEMPTEFTTSVESIIKYDDTEEEYYDGLNDDSLLSPGTINDIEDLLELEHTTWSYDPWWANLPSDTHTYIVEQDTVAWGTIGTWTYRRYLNNFVEMWGVASGSRSHYGTLGSTGLYAYSFTMTFPSFIVMRDENYSIFTTYKINNGFSITAGNGGKTTTGYSAYCLSNLSGAQPYILSTYVAGYAEEPSNSVSALSNMANLNSASIMSELDTSSLEQNEEEV